MNQKNKIFNFFHNIFVSKNIANKISDGKIDYFVEINILVKDNAILFSSSMN